METLYIQKPISFESKNTKPLLAAWIKGLKTTSNEFISVLSWTSLENQMTGMYILVDLNFYLCNPAGNCSAIINQLLCNPFHLWRASSSLASLLLGPTAQYHFARVKEEGERYVSPYNTRYWKS